MSSLWRTTRLLAEIPMLDLNNSQTLGVLLGTGLGVLTFSLLILMRTRWGQAKPLSKCVALSIFAHFLLFGYAYATKLILDSPIKRQVDQVIEFTLQDDVQPIEHETKEPTESEPAPWDRYADATAVQPGVTLSPQPLTLEPAETELEPQSPTAEDVLSETPLPFVTVDDSTPTPAPTVAQPTIPEPERAAAPAPIVVAPEAPPMNSRVADAAPTPEVNGPNRTEQFASAAPENNTVTRSPTPQPGAMLDIASQLQRLLDEPTVEEETPAEAQSANRETLVANQMGRAPQGRFASAVTPDGAGGVRKPEAETSTAAARVPRRIGDGEPVPKLFQSRIGQQRWQKIQQHGGSKETEEAVELALRWLAENQSASGAWIARDFGAGRGGDVRSDQDREQAGAQADTGVTGLALLAFLAHGNTHLEGPYRDNVRRALEYLIDVQGADGNLFGGAQLFAKMYCHGMATLALSEAWAISGDHGLRPAVEHAVRYIVASQHPQTGGWRYQPGDRGDMSQFGWQLLALKSAELAGVVIPPPTRSGMVRFLRTSSTGRMNGLAGYRPGDAPSRTMTAEALVCRVMLGEANRPAAIQEATDFVMEQPPGVGMPNLYYWYYGSLAMFQVQGEPWRRWNEALTKTLLARQRKDGGLEGSWDPDTRWGAYGGRVYSTAMAALSLEVYYRYLPVLR